MKISSKREQNDACISSAEHEKFGTKFNTKNIFKTLAVVMLMPAMLLTTACSSDDGLTNPNPENIIQKGYTLPVTVNVTRQGDADATNRASFNGTKLEFSTGDKLFVEGNHATAGYFVGTLDYVSDGKFSGTITTTNEYSGTTDALFATAWAYLLPAGYESYGYLSIVGSGLGTYLDCDIEKAFALTKAAAVEQFSWEHGVISGSSVALTPHNAIVNFTITGLAASTSVAVSLTDGDNTVSGSVTTASDGTATFAIGSRGGEDLKEYTLTVGGNAITLVSSSTTVEAGHIYNITRSAPAATTVTWNSTNVFNSSHSSDELNSWTTNPLTYEGIKISISTAGSDTASGFYPCFGSLGNAQLQVYGQNETSFTFTAPTGKKFTKIVITDNSSVTLNDANWTMSGKTATWSGTASSTVTLGGNNLTQFQDLKSIEFTLVDE